MTQSIMVNGKKMFEKVMVHINTQMVIDIRVIGIMIYKMVLELIIIQMVIFIKVNGLMVSLMEKEIISIMEIKEFIREIGKMEKNKALES